ncbi:MAG: glycosyltransferase family 2 protein [Oscillospiraceae bacterium]|jgi:glycosyltransferase involved in cell wall biosynthesis|nr:glycosyltransferase family 2 protein [Oscillospiraceae bacterium]
MISILMAAYNGEKYIKEQIESLLKQTVQDFKLFINDDGSSDSTYKISLEYSKKYPEKIFVTKSSDDRRGAKHNFIKMMVEHKNDYVMLCDQDDVWLLNKIEKSLNKMKEMEEQYGKTKPLLLHTDLIVVDKFLNTTSPSFKKMNKARFDKNKLNNLVVQNIVQGCTVMYNRALADLIIDVEPIYMIMHDWWLALIAAAFGEIAVLEEQTALYRQHESNAFGANKRGRVFHFFHKLLNFDEVNATLNNTYFQAGHFFTSYEKLLSKENQELLIAYMEIPGMKRVEKLKVLYKHKTWKNGFIRKIAQILAKPKYY